MGAVAVLLVFVFCLGCFVQAASRYNRKEQIFEYFKVEDNLRGNNENYYNIGSQEKEERKHKKTQFQFIKLNSKRLGDFP